MVGFLRFAAFAVVLVALLVFIVVPAIASPLLTQTVRDMGLQADDLAVTVEPFHLSLLTGRSERLHVRGSNVRIPPGQVERLDLTFGRVSFLARTFGTVKGELGGVALHAGGLDITISSIEVDGLADSADATARLNAAESEDLIALAARRGGLVLDQVRLADGALTVRLAGLDTRAGISVQGGALVLEPRGAAPVLLLQPLPTDPWRLTEAWVTTDGLTIRGVVDASRLAGRLPGVEAN